MRPSASASKSSRLRSTIPELSSRCKATRSSTRSRPSKESAARRSKQSSRRGAISRSVISADFVSRINPRAINKRVLESFAAAGAFDALEGNRAQVFAGADVILGVATAAA